MIGTLKLRSLRHKLFAGVLFTTLAALIVAGAAMVSYDLRSYHEVQVRELSTLAELTGSATTAALQFEDREFATSFLSLLRVHTQIRAAALYNAKGLLFAHYTNENARDVQLPRLPDPDSVRSSGRKLIVFKRIVDQNEILGTVYLSAENRVYVTLWRYFAIVLSVGAFALGVSLLLSSWLQKEITKPILGVISLVRDVVQRRDFSVRATRTTEDEIGLLVEALNDMLGEIEAQTEALKTSNLELERHNQEATKAAEALRISERRNRTLIEAMTSFVWTADPRRRFIETQPGWQAYTGQTEADYSAGGWRQALHPEDRQGVEARWAKAIEDVRPFECEARLWHAASSAHRLVSMRAAPVISGTHRVYEWIGTISDIDDRHRAEEEIRRLNAELEERVRVRTAQLEGTNKELESFSYSVSHDLRAPLRAIDGFSRMLEEDYRDRLDEEGRRLLSVVRAETARMGRLIDDLLAFSRLGRQPVNLAAQIDMTALAKEAAAELLRAESTERVKLQIWALPPATGDRFLLKQVWLNLLGNAIKYSSNGPNPEILVTGELADGEATYRVADNGVGFDMKHAGKLFGVFQRLHSPAEFPGTGVGLAIVHRVVTRHGGSVRATGRVGEGSTFTFTLPIRGDDGKS